MLHQHSSDINHGSILATFEAFLYTLAEGTAPTGEGRNCTEQHGAGREWDGMGRRWQQECGMGESGLRGGRISGTSAHYILSPFLGLIGWYRSTQTCARDIAGMGLS